MRFNGLYDDIVRESNNMFTRQERIDMLKKNEKVLRGNVVLNIRPEIISQFEEQLDGEKFETWLEREFNSNGEALLELLLGDY